MYVKHAQAGERMKTWKKLVAVLLSIVVLTGTVVFAETSDESIQAMIEDSAQTLSFMEGCSGYRLANQTKYPAGNSSNDWTAYILAVCGSREYYAEYLDALQKYVEQTYAENGYQSIYARSCRDQFLYRCE